LSEGEPSISEMPRLFDIFDVPKVKSLRATTKIRKKIAIEDISRSVPKTQLVETSKKKIIKFEVERGSYLLLFPTGYVEIHAPDEERMREVLLAFREELCRGNLL
jgi:hypothetical protein